MNGLNKFMVMSNINMRCIIVLLSCQMYIILIYILRLGKKSQFSRYIRITRYKSQYRTHPLKDGVKMHLLPACKFSNQCLSHISRYFSCQFTFLSNWLFLMMLNQVAQCKIQIVKSDNHDCFINISVHEIYLNIVIILKHGLELNNCYQT